MSYEAIQPNITRLERIARDLAAVLSPEGEAGWQHYIGMAEGVGTRLFKQFNETFDCDMKYIGQPHDRAAASDHHAHPNGQLPAEPLARSRPRLSAAA